MAKWLLVIVGILAVVAGLFLAENMSSLWRWIHVIAGIVAVIVGLMPSKSAN